MIIPGAVPFSLYKTSQSSDISACFRLFSVMLRWLLAKYSFNRLSASSSSTSFCPHTFVATSFVRSSFVGPNPPDKIKISDLSNPCLITSSNLSSLSPTVVSKKTLIPNEAKRSDK